MSPEKFICPECGSHAVGEMLMVETHFDEADAWSGVLQRYRCRDCASVIPAHLGERWDDQTIEQAQSEWREIYRDSQPEW